MPISQRLITLLSEMSAAILDAQKPLKVLRALAWKPEVEQAFFASGCQALPQPEYQVPTGVAASLARFQEMSHSLSGDNAVESFLREACDALATTARMLLGIGTKDFYFNSVELYGRPSSLSPDWQTTNLDLAAHFEQVIEDYRPPPYPEDTPTIPAQEAAEILGRRFGDYFVHHPVKVVLVDQLAATASSTAAEIRLHRDARFAPRDLLQIEHHEGHVHMATTLNGRSQPVIPFIGGPSARATRTQEGLAVFAEFAAGSSSLNRLRRLCDRTRAIQQAEEGASFVDIYRFFLSRGADPHGSYENARRIMRGGKMEGGAPFTKDVCYLDGLVRVTNFIRVALMKGHGELVHLLFAGKVPVRDIPLLGRLRREGIVRAPEYVPPWARDLSYLTAFMSFTVFLGRSDIGAVEQRLTDQLARAEADLT